MPKWVIPSLLLLVSFALIPYACIARARVKRQAEPRVHLVQDMDNQGRFKSQQANTWFADSRAMRAPVDGTVARGDLRDDPRFFEGKEADGYITSLPVPIDAGMLDRGRERYGVFCAPCHGLAGYGDGMVARRADRLQQGTWVPPSSFHIEPAASRPVGHLFNTIGNGIRTMPAYGSQIPVEDRWAIVGYVKALQRSQHAAIEDVPPRDRPGLR